MGVAEIDDKLRGEASPRLFEVSESSHVLRLAERFILPPFSVLDARSGEWQDRKRLWLEKGLRSEDGRTARMLAKSVKDEWAVDPDTGEEYLVGAPPGSVNAKILALTNGQSIFDPVLCEMAYLWFCPLEGAVLDPFAGGSVRGLIASYLGRRYVGIDLSASQIEANEAQADEWSTNDLLVAERPVWVHGDSWKVLAGDDARVDTEDDFDMIWTCPPYFDLEVYSDDPDDLSNMGWNEFCRRYRAIIEGAVDRLRPNRWAGIVVGEVRDQATGGYYRNFVGETIAAFEAAGACYYNESILVNPAGTLPLRTAKQFLVSRKLGKTHQTVLWFVKGDPRKAADACLNKAAMKAALGTHSIEAVLTAEDDALADDLTPHG